MSTDVPRAARNWERAFLVVTLLAAFVPLTAPYFPPVGMKHVNFARPGGVDFVHPYTGARALARLVNPYFNEEPDLADPLHRHWEVDGRELRQLYPPTHLLYDLPIVFLAGDDFELAGRLWFASNILALAGLAAIIAALLRRLGTTQSAPVLFALALVGLALCPGTSFALERGQSDIHLAFWAWLGVWLFLERRVGLAIFVIALPTVMKGYSVLLAIALFTWAVRSARHRMEAVLGAMLAMLLFVVPVASLLPDALLALRTRLGLFGPIWLNLSFRNLLTSFAPEQAAGLSLVLVAFGVIATAAVAARAARLESEGGEAWTQAVVLTAVAAQTVVACAGAMTLTYALPLVLPGLFVLGANQAALVRALSSSPRTVGLTLCTASALLMLVRTTSEQLSLASWGLLLLLGLAALAARALVVAPAPSPAQGVNTSGL